MQNAKCKIDRGEVLRQNRNSRVQTRNVHPYRRGLGFIGRGGAPSSRRFPTPPETKRYTPPRVTLSGVEQSGTQSKFWSKCDKIA